MPSRLPSVRLSFLLLVGLMAPACGSTISPPETPPPDSAPTGAAGEVVPGSVSINSGMLAWRPDLGLVVALQMSRQLLLLDPLTGQVRAQRELPGGILGDDRSPTRVLVDGEGHKLLIVTGGGPTGEVRLWDLESGSNRVLYETGDSRFGASKVAFRSDGGEVLVVNSAVETGTSTERLLRIQTDTGERRATALPSQAVDEVMYCAGGRNALLVSARLHEAWLVDASGEVVRHLTDVGKVSAAPGGRGIVLEAFSRTAVRLVDPASGEVRATFDSPWIGVRAWAADGESFLLSDGTGQVALVDAASGDLESHGSLDLELPVVIGGEGQRLFLLRDLTVESWNTATWIKEAEQRLPEPVDADDAVAYLRSEPYRTRYADQLLLAPDGARMFIASRDIAYSWELGESVPRPLPKYQESDDDTLSWVPDIWPQLAAPFAWTRSHSPLTPDRSELSVLVACPGHLRIVHEEEDGSIVLYTDDGSVVRRLLDQRSGGGQAACSADGRLIAVPDHDGGRVAIFDAVTGESEAVASIATYQLAIGGDYLLARNDDNEPQLLLTTTGEQVPYSGPMGVLSSDGHILAVEASSTEFHLIEFPSGRPLHTFSRPAGQEHAHVMQGQPAFTMNGAHVYSSWNGRRYIWNVETGELLLSYDVETGSFDRAQTRLAFCRLGRLKVLSMEEGTGSAIDLGPCVGKPEFSDTGELLRLTTASSETYVRVSDGSRLHVRRMDGVLVASSNGRLIEVRPPALNRLDYRMPGPVLEAEVRGLPPEELLSDDVVRRFLGTLPSSETGRGEDPVTGHP